MNDHNIELVFQVPRSPYCNALDLGVWCSLQARVEKTHSMRLVKVGALVNSVYQTHRRAEEHG